MSNTSVSDALKCEANPARKPRKAKRAHRGTMILARLRLYQPLMRVMHRLGWCYPERTLANETGVWCHWCGMRGTRSPMLTGQRIMFESGAGDTPTLVTPPFRGSSDNKKAK